MRSPRFPKPKLSSQPLRSPESSSSLRRYWLPQECILSDQGLVRLQGEIFHHVFDVCREGLSSQFEVLGDGTNCHQVEVFQINRREASARILHTRTLPRLSRPHLHLVLSMPKLSTFESVLEKSVEMGVYSIHPFLSERSFRPPTWKQERWDRIVVSALQQSGRCEPLKVHPLTPMDQLPSIWSPSSDNNSYPNDHHNSSPSHGSESIKAINKKSYRVVFAYEGLVSPDRCSISLRQILRSQESQEMEVKDVWILVGSEGGFSPQEVEWFWTLGIAPLSLGPQILRVETACLTLVALVKHELGLWGC